MLGGVGILATLGARPEMSQKRSMSHYLRILLHHRDVVKQNCGTMCNSLAEAYNCNFQTIHHNTKLATSTGADPVILLTVRPGRYFMSDCCGRADLTSYAQ